MSSPSTPTLPPLETAKPPFPSGDDSAAHAMPPLSHDVVMLLRDSITQMLAHPVTPDPKTAPPKQPFQSRAPQCTHIAMTRLHGHNACMLCHRVPEVGFLYVCEQDHVQEIRKAAGHANAVLPLVPDHGNIFEGHAQMAKSLGMNASIINQIRAGEYSQEQIDLLLAQRRSVNDVVAQVEKAKLLPRSNRSVMKKLIAATRAEENKKNTNPTPVLPMPSIEQVVREVPAAETVDNLPEEGITGRQRTLKVPKCNFKVCHACRPIFKDRVPSSFEAVFNHEVVPDFSEATILNANHARNLGLRPVATPTSEQCINTNLYSGNESDELSDDSLATSSSSDFCYDPNYIDPYPCPGALVCPLYTPSAGCAYDQGFDDGNKAINHGFVPEDTTGLPTSAPSTTPEDYPYTPNGLGASPSNSSSISLPDPVMEPLTPSRPYFHSQLNFTQLRGDATIVTEFSGRGPTQQSYVLPPYNLHGKKSNSGMGSEIEVDGGVVLTEEAVETGIPDILSENK